MSTAAPSPMHAQVEKLLKVAVDNGATELRLSGGVAPMLRINDQLRPLKTRPIPTEEVTAMAEAIMPPHADPAKFFFAANGGRYAGSLIDNSGTKVLVLRPTDEPEPEPTSFMSDAPLELDIQKEDKGVALPADASGEQQIVQP